MYVVEVLGWVATITLLIGYVLNARQHISSWITWMGGNSLMAAYGWLIESYSLLFLSVVLVCLNVYGYFSWKSNQK